MDTNVGVLLTAHGTVSRVDELGPFLQNIRRGRPTPAHVLDEVTRRYTAIGGSPLLKTTYELAGRLNEKLGVPVFVGMRLWHPYIAETLDEIATRGIERLVSLPLAPQSVHVYNDAVREALAARKNLGSTVPSLIEVGPYGEAPELTGAYVDLVNETLARFAESERDEVAVILSAHSLPTRVIASGDPYEVQFRAMASAIASQLAHPAHLVRVAFQSQGFDGGDWLGPDLPTTFAELVSAGVRKVVVAAVGFTADHVETLYDLDIEAPQLAAKAGITRMERAPSLNARPAFVDALSAVVRPYLQRLRA